MRKIERVILLVQLENDNIHQVLTTDEQESELLMLLLQSSQGDRLKILDKPIDSIEIEK